MGEERGGSHGEECRRRAKMSVSKECTSLLDTTLVHTIYRCIIRSLNSRCPELSHVGSFLWSLASTRLSLSANYGLERTLFRTHFSCSIPSVVTSQLHNTRWSRIAHPSTSSRGLL